MGFFLLLRVQHKSVRKDELNIVNQSLPLGYFGVVWMDTIHVYKAWIGGRLIIIHRRFVHTGPRARDIFGQDLDGWGMRGLEGRLVLCERATGRYIELAPDQTDLGLAPIQAGLVPAENFPAVPWAPYPTILSRVTLCNLKGWKLMPVWSLRERVTEYSRLSVSVHNGRLICCATQEPLWKCAATCLNLTNGNWHLIPSCQVALVHEVGELCFLLERSPDLVASPACSFYTPTRLQRHVAEGAGIMFDTFPFPLA